MKNIIYIFIAAIVISACAPAASASSTATITPNTCKVYSLKSWYEMGIPLDGSFSQIVASDGGVTSGIVIKSPEINFLKSINGAGSGSWSWAWAADAEKGKYYQSILGVSIDSAVGWNWVGAPSPDQRIYPGVRNVMCVSKIVRMYGVDYAFVVGAPKGLDYAKYQLDWLVQPVYGNWEWQKTDGSWAGMPRIWNAYVFDPASGFEMRTASDKQFRFPAAWLYQYLRTDTIPWLTTATNTPQATISTLTNTPNLPTPTFTPALTLTATLAPTLTPTPGAGTVVWIIANPYLSVRPGASMSNVPVGFFYIGTELNLSEIVRVGNDVWGREGNGYWIALRLNGKCYVTPCPP